MSLFPKFGATLAALFLVGCLAPPDRSPDGSGEDDGRSYKSPLPAPKPLPAGFFHLPWGCGDSFYVSQGNRGDECGIEGNHQGVEEYAWDFGLPLETPVLASGAGVVTLAVTPSPPGSECFDGCPQDTGGSDLDSEACCSRCLPMANRVNVEHADGSASSYSHLSKVLVQVGQKVAAGDLLGYSGTSGCSTGPHMHFQVMYGCSDSYCQSAPISFAEAGVPTCGEQLVSRNSCGD